METIIQYLEENTELKGMELADNTEYGYLFIGYNEEDDTDEELEIHVTYTNQVYINDEEQDIYLPFNVWSL